MSWAENRKHVIEAILVAVAVAFIAIVTIATLYRTPSCFDHKQDQGEQGIDCGGPCPYLCAVDEIPVSVGFVRTVNPEPGRTDVIAYVNNSNANAGVQGAAYELDLYSAENRIISHITGTMNLPPSTISPLYIPNAYDGSQPISQAFLTFATSSINWLRTFQKPVAPLPSNIEIKQGETPSVTATIENSLAIPLYNVVEVATVFNAAGNAIAASQTVVPDLPAQGTAPLTYTWNEPFAQPPIRVEILPAYGP